MCCHVPAGTACWEQLLPRQRRAGLQLSASPSTCPQEEPCAVGSSRAAADVLVALLHVPSQPSLSISTMNKTIPQAAPPATFIHYVYRHSPVRYSLRTVTALKRSGRKKLMIMIFPFAHSSGGRRAGGWHTRAQGMGRSPRSITHTATHCHQTGVPGHKCVALPQGQECLRCDLRVLSARGDLKALWWALRA